MSSNASLPSSVFSNIMLIVQNWLWWEYLHHRNRQLLQIGLLFCDFVWLPLKQESQLLNTCSKREVEGEHSRQKRQLVKNPMTG